jgi:hypothetical protein
LSNNGGTITGQANLVPTSAGTISAGVITATVTPQFGPLQNNGGPTPTLLPSLIHGLVDAGSTAVVTSFGLTTDQRGSGFPRSDSNGVDLGAIQSPLTGPSIISAATAQFIVGHAGGFTVIASSKPLSSLSETGTLPTGVTFVNNGDGTATISGTPTAASAGQTYTITITATNNTGTSQSASQTFKLTVVEQAAITSAAADTFVTGQAGSFTITTVGFPTPSLTATGTLPAGLTFVDNGNGTAILSGTPAAGTGGTYTLPIDAHNGVLADATQSLSLTVDQPPAITNPNFDSLLQQTFSSFLFTTTGFPTASITETGTLPTGLSFVDNGNGTASFQGQAINPGNYPLTITASDGVGTSASQAFTLQVTQYVSITSPQSVTYWTGQSASFTVTTYGFPTPSLAFTGTPPPGFSFVDNGNGTATISGLDLTQYSAPGVANYPLTIYATNNLERVSAPLTITIKQAPQFLNAPSTFTFNENQSNSFVVRAIGAPNLFLGQSGAYVPGVTFHDNGDGTGTLSGTPPLGSGGVYHLTFYASNGDPTYAQQTLTLTIPEPPAFTNGGSPLFVAGRAGSFTITASGYPTPTLTETGAFPTGVLFVDNGNGTATIGGTPTASSGGKYALTISASSPGTGTITETLNLVVDPTLQITSGSTADFSDVPGGLFGIKTNSLVGVTQYTENGPLPSGITFNPSVGLFSGSSDATGNYPVVVTAQSSDGQTSPHQNLTLTVGQAPVLSLSGHLHDTFYEGQSGSVTFAATGFPAPTFTETGALPSGVTFVDNGNGTATLSGTPATGTANMYFPQITAQNQFGISSNAVLLTVLTLPVPITVTSAPAASFTAGATGTFTVTTSGNPVPALSKTGVLPGGLTFVDNGNGTATIRGTPAANEFGNFPINIVAASTSNTVDSLSGSSDSFSEQTLVLTIDQPPSLAANGSSTIEVGQSDFLGLAVSGFPAPMVTISGTLPAGVTFDAPYGLVGTPAAGSEGTYPLALSASNGVGTNATLNVTLSVVQPPAITSKAFTTFVAGQANTFTVQTTGSPTATITESGALPPGVTFVDNGNGTATLSGTPVALQSTFAYNVTITAHNGAGPDSVQNFSLNVDFPPQFAGANATTFTVGQAGSFTIAGGGYPEATVSVTGNLPTGVTVTNNPEGSATIAGTPAPGTGGNYKLTLIATNGAGTAAAERFTLVVDEDVRFTNPNSFLVYAGYPVIFTATAIGFPHPNFLSYTGSLPSYMTFDPSSNSFSGVPVAATPPGQPDLIHLSVTNPDDTTSTQTVQITVIPQPTVTSPSSTTFYVGQPNSFKITTSSTVTPHIALNPSELLPSGLTFVDNGDGTGTLSGSPTAAYEGLTNLSLNVTVGNSTLPYLLSLNIAYVPPQAPQFTNPFPSVTFFTAQPASLLVTTAAFPTAAITLSSVTQSGTSVSLSSLGLSVVDNGNGTATIAGMPPAGAVGSYSLTVQAANSAGTTPKTFNLTISAPTPVSFFIVDGFGTPITAGALQTVTVTAKDAYYHTATWYRGTVIFSSTDPQAVLPSTYTFTAADEGIHTFGVVLRSAGTLQSIQANDSTTPSISGGIGNFTVDAAAPSKFLVRAPGGAAGGGAFNVTVTAQDAYGNTATGYTGTVSFASSDGQAVLPANYTFTANNAFAPNDNGVHTFSAMLNTPGIQSITVSDSANSGMTGSSAAIPVSAASGFTVSAPASITAGTPFNVTVTAVNSSGQTATGYAGTVSLESSDGQAVLPASYTFTAADQGVHTFSVTLKTAGTQSITASDRAISSVSGTGTGIAVSPAAANKFLVSAPATIPAGTALSATVTAMDAYGNVSTGYTGTAALSSSDSQALLPAAYTFKSADQGVHTFALTLKTAGSQSITATDTSSASVTGMDAGITVTPPMASQFLVIAPASVTAGAAFNVTITAADASGNAVSGYTGTVSLTSSDGQAILPANYTFTAADKGVHIFSVTLKTSGTQSITTKDTTTTSITGSDASIAVAASATPSKFLVVAPSSATAGTAFSVTVTAANSSGQTVTGYAGTVTFSSSDGQAVLPGNYTFTSSDKGVHTFSVTLKTFGSQSLTAKDTKTTSITGSDAAITVSPAAASALVVTAPTSVQQGTAFSLTATAQDAYGNTATGYGGTVTFSSSDKHAVLPGSYTFTSSDNGVHTFSVTLKTAGTQSVTVKDTKTSSISGSDSRISVAGFTVNDGDTQQSMVTHLVYTFAAPTQVDPGAFVLLRNGKPTPIQLIVTPQPDLTTYIITFSGPGVINGSVPDGSYTLYTLHTKVSVISGPPLAQDDVNTFVRLFGDVNGDGVVNGADKAVLKQAESDPPSTYVADFDYNGTGSIDNKDVAQFTRRLGERLKPPARPPASFPGDKARHTARLHHPSATAQPNRPGKRHPVL